MTKYHTATMASLAIVLQVSSVFAQATEPTDAAPAPADEPAAAGSLSFSTSDGMSAEGQSAAPATTGSEPAWIDRYAPEAGMFELGAAVGLLFPSADHNLQLESLPHYEIATTPELVLRGSWLPLSWLGVEAEGAVGPSTTDDPNEAQSYPWSLRGHLMLQLPLWSVVPFAVAGLGELGNVSNAMGSDGDPLTHFGIGAKVFLDEDTLIRLDLRDNMTQKNDEDDGEMTHSPEIMLGVSMTFGRTEAAKTCQPEDTDGDGIVDRADACPTVPGQGRDGCPIKDTDGDGFLDDADKCIDVPGVAPDGCPADADGDGIPDDKDACPKEAGPAPQGCPAPKDSDGDGILDKDDKCPSQPETKNNYQDSDGCPDEIPEKVKQFTGTIKGITFELNKAVIRPTSKPTLDQAAAVLVEYKDLRVMISGHTDNTGTRERNLTLSGERAESVRQYLIQKGVDGTRIETKGVGPDEPVESNDTPKGREANRRIDFALIK